MLSDWAACKLQSCLHLGPGKTLLFIYTDKSTINRTTIAFGPFFTADHLQVTYHIIYIAEDTMLHNMNFYWVQTRSGVRTNRFSIVPVSNYFIRNPLRTKIFFPMAHYSLLGQGLLINEVSPSHSVGLLWTSDQPVQENSTWQHTTLTADIHPFMLPVGFEPAIPTSKRHQTHALERAATGIGLEQSIVK
jgi:hypothetical protein